MGVLFISHSSADNAAAIRVREWLREHGWNQVFLDLDAEQGIVPGHRWQQELKLAGERCSGVILLISPNWAASRWCQTEFLVADQLGKKIFPILIAPTNFDEMPRELPGRFQFADISTEEREAEGFARLGIGLKRAGLDPQSFTWPPPDEPNRPIYRGLQSLDEADAAIFFGRDALITKGMDTIRRIRQGAPERVLVILGASGAGKSSFLKAGLVARMKRDEENFLVVPTVRPERAAVSGPNGLAASFGCDPAQAGNPEKAFHVLANLREAAAKSFQRYAADGTGAQLKPPTIVIPLDQAEELFLPENREAMQAIDVLSRILRADAGVVVVATIRSDSFQKLQAEPRLADIPLLPFSLPPIPLGAFKEVIEGPARLASPPLTIEPSLCDRLLEDLAAEDALPLLAFTLERLLARHPQGGKITLKEYAEEFGGLEGAIVGAVEAAFSEAMRDPALPHSHVELEKLARAAFIPALVHLDDTDAMPRRRVEPLESLPSATQPLVKHLINQRLLVCHKNTVNGVEIDTVEVTHEAILRQWPALRAWIAEERGALRALDAVRDAAAEWRTHSSANGEGWLAHRGGRLQEADALLGRQDFATALDPTVLEYLAACRAQESAERSREKEALERTRRLQRRIGFVILAAAVIVILAGASVLRLFSGMSRQASESLSALAAKEAAALDYDRAARYAAAGLSGVGWGASGTAGAAAAAELQGAAAASSAVIVLRGHANQVLGAAFSPEGRRLLTASRDKTARIWDAATGQQIAILRGHTGAVLNAAFSPDGKRIVTASEDRTARIWNESSGSVVLRGHGQTVSSAAFNWNGSQVVTSSYDGTARVWDANSGRKILVLQGHSDAVESAAFSPDGKRIITGSDDRTVRIWDAQSGKQLSILSGHTGVIESVAFSSDGRRIVTASDDKTARIWDASTAQQLEVLRGHTGAVTSAAFSRNGNYVVTTSGDKTARLWNVSDGRELVRFVHDDAVNTANFSRDGNRIVTASDDFTAHIWDTRKGMRVLRGHEGIVTAVAFSPDGKRIATASVDRTIRLWDVGTGVEIASLPGHQGFVETVAFSPDGTRCVSGSDDATARIWDTRTGRQLAILRGHNDAVYGAAYSPDGRKIVTASIDGTARIWDAATGHTTAILRGDRKVISANFNFDNTRLITSFSNGTAAVWDSRTGNRLFALRGHEKAVNSASFSRDSKSIVTASQDGTARIWDALSGRQIAVLSAHEDERPVMSAEFSPDGKLIATASQDQTVRLWDAATAREIAILRGHEAQVNGVSFSADGKRLASASADGTVRVWNISGTASESSDGLLRRVCATALAHGLSAFSAEELRSAEPALNPAINADACHPPGMWARLGSIFWAGFSN